jgi:hypothetical protein
MTLGADKKKVAALAVVLVLLGGYSVYTNLLSGPELPRAANIARERPAAENPSFSASGGGPSAPVTTRSRVRSGDSGFHPVLRKKGEEKNRIDPLAMDPTLRRDRLKKVQAVNLAGGSRNLFQYGTPPPAKADLPKGDEPKVVPTMFVGPKQPPPPPPPAPPAPPPPIPLKFYAFWVSRDDGRKTACFLDGEDIVMASEGETLKRRYRVVRINPASVVMEDLEVKKQQTLPLAEEAPTQGE